MSKFAYLSEIFCQLNKLNTSLQGLHKYLKLRNKTEAFKQKLALWDGFVQKGDTEVFSTSMIFNKC